MLNWCNFLSGKVVRCNLVRLIRSPLAFPLDWVSTCSHLWLIRSRWRWRKSFERENAVAALSQSGSTFCGLFHPPPILHCRKVILLLLQSYIVTKLLPPSTILHCQKMFHCPAILHCQKVITFFYTTILYCHKNFLLLHANPKITWFCRELLCKAIIVQEKKVQFRSISVFTHI